MSLVININAVNRTNQIDWTSVKKTEVASKQSDTLNFLIKNYGTKTYRPAINDVVQFMNGATKVFEGIVTGNQETVQGLARYFSITCKDYTHTLDRMLVSKTYQNMTAGAIISDLISTFTTGFTTTGVVAPTLVSQISFNYITVSQCLEKLTKIVQGYVWYVDYNKNINFFVNVLNVSPFSLSDTGNNYIFGTLNIKSDVNQLRNDIYIRGGSIISSTTRTETFVADGVNTVFALGLKYNVVPTIILNGVTQTVGLENINPAGSNQAYWDFNQKTIRFDTIPTNTHVITVTGTYLYPLIFRKQNNLSVETYGIFQHLIIDKTIITIDGASQRADVEIAQYATPTNSGSFKTNNAGLIAGQRLTIDSTIRSLSEDYLIQQIDTIAKTPTTLQYTVKIESYSSFGIIDVLKQLLVTNATEELDIAQNESIQRFVQFNENALMTDTLLAPTKKTGPYKWGPDANQGVWGFSTWS